MSTVLKSLFPKTRRMILEILFLHSEQRFYVRELIRLVRTGQGSVQREVDNLVECGILFSQSEAGRRYVQVNRQSPVFEEIKELINKTAGMKIGLQKIFSVVPDISIAFIFGSMVKGRERNDSDVDVLVIGNVRFRTMVSLLADEQRRIGREINPVIYSLAEFHKLAKKDDHFVTELLKTQKEFIIGTEDDLETMVGKSMAS